MDNQIKNPSSTGFPPVENSNRKEIFLDTKGSCFLCLKETQNGTFDTGLLKVSHQNICRYLNINPYSILLESLSGDCFTEEDKKEAFYQSNNLLICVKLCSKCSKMSNKLSELINQLEMTEMLLKNQLQEYYDTLVESEQEEGRESQWNNFQQKINVNSSNPNKISLVEKLRHETRVNSVARLESLNKIYVPEVELEKVNSGICKRKVNQQSEGVSESSASTPSYLPSKLFKTPNKRNRTDDLTFIMNDKNVTKDQFDSNNSSDASLINEVANEQEENVVKSNCNNNSPVITKPAISVKNKTFSKFSICPHKTKLDYFRMHSKSFELTKRYDCRYCDIYGTNNVNGGLADFSKHLLTQHPEILFASSKHLQLSEKEFSYCCTKVLNLEIGIGKSEAKSRGLKSGLHSCLFCHHSYKRAISFKHHFVFNHYNNFVSKLIDFQENLIKEKVVESRTCANQVQETNFESVSMNNFQDIMDQESMQNSQNADNIGESSTGFNPVSPKLLDQTNFINNQFPPVFQENLTTTAINSSVIASPQNVQTQSEYKHFINNILTNHYKLSESPTHNQLCNYCSYITKHGMTNISVHLVTWHPEKLFVLSKFPQLHEEEFLSCCRQVLDSELETFSRTTKIRELYPSSIVKGQSSLTFCAICNQCYKSKTQFKYHFVFKHFNSFEAKLIENQHKMYTNLMIQAGPSLENSHYFRNSIHQVTRTSN